tara:strand:+ start:1839 stop:2033 length:195 start_codon:yes stop_codon:yes gene_type:complete
MKNRYSEKKKKRTSFKSKVPGSSNHSTSAEETETSVFFLRKILIKGLRSGFDRFKWNNFHNRFD